MAWRTRPLTLGGLGQNGLLGELQTLALTVGVGLNRSEHHLIRIDGAKSAVLNT